MRVEVRRLEAEAYALRYDLDLDEVLYLAFKAGHEAASNDRSMWRRV